MCTLKREYIYYPNMTSQFNAIEWWNSNIMMFWTLLKMACDFFSIPISSVVWDSAFSASGRVIEPHYPNTAQALILLGRLALELLLYWKRIKGYFSLILSFFLNLIMDVSIVQYLIPTLKIFFFVLLFRLWMRLKISYCHEKSLYLQML